MKKYLFIAAAMLLMVAASIETKAQKLQTLLSEYSLATDTVTNGGVGFVTVRNSSIDASDRITIQAIALELSGTTAGTITLQGSIDGTNYKAIPTDETQTSVTTATATDVTTAQVFIWRLKTNDFNFYRISWTGSGTMSATLAGSMISRKTR